jgi:hypothetical protein
LNKAAQTFRNKDLWFPCPFVENAPVDSVLLKEPVPMIRVR